MLSASFLMCLFCVLCYTGQTFFNKLYSVHYSGPESAATPVFASVYGIVVSAATLAYNSFRLDADGATLLFGIVNGVVLFLFNLAAISAARTGPYAFQSIMMLFGNILLPMAFSVFFWGDRLTAVKLLGIAVMLASFVVFNAGGLGFGGVKKGYYFWVAVLFAANGVYGILVDSQQRIAAGTQRNEMIIITFAVSAVISLVFLAAGQGKKAVSAFRMDGKTWGFALGSSICAAVAINVLMLSLRLVPASVLYTAENGGVLILSALLSAVTLKEKLTKPMIAGIAVAVLSLFLLSA